MKHLVSLLLLLLPVCGFAQVVAVQNDKQNIVYLGMNAPLTVAMENCPAKSIVVTTNNGKVEPDGMGRKGHYSFWPAQQGMAIVYVSRKTAKGVKLIDSTYFRVLLAPLESITVGGRLGGSVSKLFINQQIAPAALMGVGCGRFQVISFRVVVLRRKKEIFDRTLQNNDGTRFDSTTRACFNRLRNNDKVVLREFVLRGPELTPRKENRVLEFIITNADEYNRRQTKHGEIQLEDPVTGEIIIRKW